MFVLRKKTAAPRDWAALLLLAAPFGCGPASVEKSSVAVPPSPAPSASVLAAPTSSAAVPAVDLSSIPAPLRVLFTFQPARAYTRVVDGVSTKVQCTTLEPYWLEGVVRGLLECTTDAKPLRIRYSATSAGLFLETDTWIPTLSVPPETDVIRFDAGENDENIRCTRAQEPEANGLLCATTKCQAGARDPMSFERFCADGMGVVSYETEKMGHRLLLKR